METIEEPGSMPGMECRCIWNPASIIASLSVEYANVLIEELKKTQK